MAEPLLDTALSHTALSDTGLSGTALSGTGLSGTGLSGTGLLDTVLAPHPPPFALLHRPESTGQDTLDVLIGDVSTPRTLAEIPLPGGADESGGAGGADGAAGGPGRAGHEVLAIVPYQRVVDRGFAGRDDGSALIAMTIVDQATASVAEIMSHIADVPIELSDGHFDIDDETYAQMVGRIIADEIGTGEGSNFVIKRSFVADITRYTPRAALSVFRRLLRQESGAYWTFIVHTGERTFVGATPERHISVRDGTAVMNPISGTYRYPAAGPSLDGIMSFLADRKEADELYMVVDEELKMMARICTGGGRVVGPYLKEMARLAHTEYFIEGRTARDPREILHETMFAPTVTGSPLESACRVIARHEPQGRGYYGGIIALIGHDQDGGRTLDSSILIRTADIDRRGRVRLGVGATLVRHSDPAAEVAETRAKAASLLSALGGDEPGRWAEHPSVRAALELRNATVADFWLNAAEERSKPEAALADRTVLVVDAEDAFTSMLDHQLRSLGLRVTVRRFDEPHDLDKYDLVVMGPGPGDPRDTGDRKITHLRRAITTLLARRRPFLAVCLSHQVLSSELGFPLVRREVPNQGVQQRIDLFGMPERVGFYNTFSARSQDDKVHCGDIGVVEVCRDQQTGEVHATRGPHFASLQFHAESLLTHDGVRIIATTIKEVLAS